MYSPETEVLIHTYYDKDFLQLLFILDDSSSSSSSDDDTPQVPRPYRAALFERKPNRECDRYGNLTAKPRDRAAAAAATRHEGKAIAKITAPKEYTPNSNHKTPSTAYSTLSLDTSSKQVMSPAGGRQASRHKLSEWFCRKSGKPATAPDTGNGKADTAEAVPTAYMVLSQPPSSAGAKPVHPSAESTVATPHEWKTSKRSEAGITMTDPTPINAMA
ncbi:hypothetical protein BDZ88DRAFT_442757, partial [Geranomyces variabilis]